MIVKQYDDKQAHESWLIVVIEANNLPRMRRADPITIQAMALGGVLKPFLFPQQIRLCIAYDENPDRVRKIIANVGAEGLLQYLRRKEVYDETQGDGAHWWSATDTP